MKNSDCVVLGKIVKYCNDVSALMEQYDSNYERYESEISFQYACNMCIIQIGELVGRLSEEFVSEHNQVPWRSIKGMRNLHAHDYDNVDLEIVWNTLIEDIPGLKEEIQKILN